MFYYIITPIAWHEKRGIPLLTKEGIKGRLRSRAGATTPCSPPFKGGQMAHSMPWVIGIKPSVLLNYHTDCLA